MRGTHSPIQVHWTTAHRCGQPSTRTLLSGLQLEELKLKSNRVHMQGNPPGQSVRRSVTSPVLTPSRWRAALPPGGSFTLCLLLLVLHGGFPCISSAANRIVSPLGQSGNGSQDPLPGWPGEESGRQ